LLTALGETLGHPTTLTEEIPVTKPIIAKTLEVHVEETDGDNNRRYTFKVYEFTNGVIMVPSDQTHDWFFVDRDSIEANGLGVVVGVTETEDTVTFSREELRQSIAGSIGEFGSDDATRKALRIVSRPTCRY
jgi:hypothetical protein